MLDTRQDRRATLLISHRSSLPEEKCSGNKLINLICGIEFDNNIISPEEFIIAANSIQMMKGY